MGSSTRKIDEKIKKMLKTENDGKEQLSIEEAIPIVATEALRMKKTRKYFGDKDFLNLLQGGIIGITAAKNGQLKDYLGGHDYDYDIDKEDEFKKLKLIDNILEKVENDYDNIESSLILTAFRLAMVENILINNDELKFITDFSVNVLYLFLMENVNEILSDVYLDKSTSDYDEKVKQYAENIIKEDMSVIISSFMNKEIEISEVIESIIAKSENIKGEF